MSNIDLRVRHKIKESLATCSANYHIQKVKLKITHKHTASLLSDI